MHLVVTGAGGFIGGFLAHWFSDRGETVTAITRRPRGDARERRGMSWRQADLCAPGSLPDRFDVLVHCAAETPAQCPDPAALYQGNVLAAERVLEQALAAGARAVVLMSSMSVYGTISVPVVGEDTPPQNPDPYGRAKQAAEGLLASCIARGLPSALALRLPGTVGKGSHHNFLSEALARVRAGQAVTANHPDALFNNIVYVGDLAEFLGRWLADPRAGYTVTNLAAVEPICIREVVELLFESSGRPARMTVMEGGKQPFLISVDRAEALGYRPGTVRASVRAFVRDSLAG